MDLGLKDRAALVTGASKGLGRAVAERLAMEGADVVVNSRSAEALEATAAEIARATGRRVLSVAGDVADEAFCAHPWSARRPDSGVSTSWSRTQGVHPRAE